MRERIDWEALAVSLGTYVPGSSNEYGSDDAARTALAAIIGADEIASAVDHYVVGRRGGQLARSVLWLLKPAAASARCIEIYESSSDQEDRRMAVELLRVVDDGRSMSRIPEFLADPDLTIQGWGVGLLDQLLQEGLVDVHDAEPFIRLAEGHPNEAVRERADFIRSFCADRWNARPT